MADFFKLCRIASASFILTFTTIPTILAEQPVGFPWPGAHQAKKHGNPQIGDPQSGIYRILPHASSGLRGDLHPKSHSTLPPDSYQTLAEKTHYAYGWFGSNPTPHWGRHFRYTNDHIQWTRR